MSRYWVAPRHPDQHAAKSGHLETLSRVSSAEIAMRCGAQRGPSTRGTANPTWATASTAYLHQSLPFVSAGSTLGRHLLSTAPVCRRPIYRFQTGIASATAPPSHWPGGLRLGCGAAESQHCPITPTWLALGRRFRQRRVGRRQLSIDRSRLWRQCSVSTLVVVEARGLRKVSLKPFPSHFKTEQTPRQPVRQLTTHSEQHSLSQSKTLPLSPTLSHPRTPTHPNPKSPSANHPPSPQTHIPLHSRVTTQPPSLTTTQPRHDSTAGYRPPGCPEETT